ncbi:MAG: aminomethyl-transferring glycine dehydrogenase subunit GcvPA [Myxococcota bacterium]
MRYLPHTADDTQSMLKHIGVASVADLFASIPDHLKVKGLLKLPPALSEPELRRELERLAGPRLGPQFLGAGAYPHAVPSAVEQLLLRSELYTAYTPYQPEVAQGTLQSMFEFQTVVAELFGMEVANASMYDGASSTAEAALMALRVAKKRTKVVVSAAVHPEYREVVQTFIHAGGAGQVVTVARDDKTGGTDLGALSAAAKDAACIIIQTPSFFGSAEDGAAISKIAKDNGALLVVAVPEVMSLGLFQPPGAFGADIVTGEGLGYGVGVQIGGPACGLFAAKMDFVRNMPGRLVGETVDTEGDRGYVLTLSTREQHIRREKATSNICTNQGLLALGFVMHMALLGKQGLIAAARQNMARALHVKTAFGKLGLSPRFTGPHFNEVAYKLPSGKKAAAVIEAATQRGVVAGLDLGRFDASLSDTLLVCTTEVHSTEDVAALIDAVKEAVSR